MMRPILLVLLLSACRFDGAVEVRDAPAEVEVVLEPEPCRDYFYDVASVILMTGRAGCEDGMTLEPVVGVRAIVCRCPVQP